MPAPSVGDHLEGLVGTTIPTASGFPNRVIDVTGNRVTVETGDPENPGRDTFSLNKVQEAADRVFAGEEVPINTASVGSRSAFVGAVLRSLPGVEVLTDPARARLARGGTQRNPAWEYDELVLSLDLYRRREQPPATDPEVIALSELLNRLPIHQERPDAERFRNPNGVHLKLANWKAIDPNYPGVGMERGGRARMQAVWDRFANDPVALAAAVERITATADGRAPVLPPEEDEAEAVEGRILFRQHRARERNPALVKRKKVAEMRRHGRLACEVCGFDFAATYGELGEGFIECHHKLPLATAGTRTTQIGDLALVCPNCHRMLHRSREPLPVEALRVVVRGS